MSKRVIMVENTAYQIHPGNLIIPDGLKLDINKFLENVYLNIFYMHIISTH
jgi:hypothetical protein